MCVCHGEGREEKEPTPHLSCGKLMKYIIANNGKPRVRNTSMLLSHAKVNSQRVT